MNLLLLLLFTNYKICITTCQQNEIIQPQLNKTEN